MRGRRMNYQVLTLGFTFMFSRWHFNWHLTVFPSKTSKWGTFSIPADPGSTKLASRCCEHYPSMHPYSATYPGLGLSGSKVTPTSFSLATSSTILGDPDVFPDRRGFWVCPRVSSQLEAYAKHLHRKAPCRYRSCSSYKLWKNVHFTKRLHQ